MPFLSCSCLNSRWKEQKLSNFLLIQKIWIIFDSTASLSKYYCYNYFRAVENNNWDGEAIKEVTKNLMHWWLRTTLTTKKAQQLFHETGKVRKLDKKQRNLTGLNGSGIVSCFNFFSISQEKGLIDVTMKLVRSDENGFWVAVCRAKKSLEIPFN